MTWAFIMHYYIVCTITSDIIREAKSIYKNRLNTIPLFYFNQMDGENKDIEVFASSYDNGYIVPINI